MITAALLLGVVLALALSALSSGAETGTYCLDRVRLRVACDQRDPAARRVEQLVRRPEDMVIATLVGTNVADYVATACATALLLRVAVPAEYVEFYTTALITPLVLVFGGIVPKDWFRRESNRLLALLSWPLLIGMRAVQTTGAIWLLRSLTRVLIRCVDPTRAASDSELLPRARTVHLLREGAVRGGLTSFQRDLIERVLNLSGVRVSDVMIRRQRAIIVPQDIARDDFLRIARMAHFSRIPLHWGDPRRVVGIVNVYDVLTDRETKPIAAYARTPLTLAEGVSVSTALVQLQRARETMAIVQDRAGNAVGLLTLKDLVEEIVGDLEVW